MSMIIDKHYYYELTKELEPIESGTSLHVHGEIYKVGNEKISLFWNISSKSLAPDEVEVEPWVEPILERTLSSELTGWANQHLVNKKVLVKGWVSQFRELKKMSFLVLRDREGYCQIVIPKELSIPLLSETVVEIIGTLKLEPQCKYGGVEIIAEKINIISEAAVLPFPISREEGIPPFNTLNIFRPLTLRKEKERCIFKIQSEVINAYREYMRSQGFIEIQSTKLSAAGLEGGADMFNIDYFGEPMYLTQSPQFYKQMMVGVYERVFEVGKVYRAEGSNTNKHLSEFVGFDFEMGFINSVEEVMEMEENALNYIFRHINGKCNKELEHLGVEIKANNVLSFLPFIPRIAYNKVVEILKSEYNFEFYGIGLNTEAERLIGEYAKTYFNSEFVFITEYPLSERPFYAMPSDDGVSSETFELLYKGMEITSGGQRIHNYEQLCESIKAKGLNPENFESYLMPFKFGMPPHGGMGLGVERLLKQMLGLQTADEASLIPRTREKYIH